MAVRGETMTALAESVHSHHILSLFYSNDAATDKKRAKTQMENGDVKASPSSSSGNALNLPIANPKAKAAIVKVYGDDTDGSSFSLNDCYEFVGIVSLDPSLAAFPTDGTENDVVEQFGQQERLTKSPPPSLVPRYVKRTYM